jgi:hypothetical protein
MKRGTVMLMVVAMLCVPASSAPPARITGIYSNLKYSSEGGDLLGMELIVVPAGSGHTVFVQIAQGELETSIANLEVDGRKVVFDMPEDGAYAGQHFTGVLTATGMQVKWAFGDIENLKRGKSYWQ